MVLWVIYLSISIFGDFIEIVLGISSDVVKEDLFWDFFF